MSKQDELRKIREALEAQGVSAGLISATTLYGELTSAASDIKVTAPTGKELLLKLGDASGAKKVKVLDSADQVVVHINSDGLVTAVGFAGPLTGDVTGNLTGDVTGNADTATLAEGVTGASDADVAITAKAGYGMVAKLGDHAGAKKLTVKDDQNATVATIDSDGTITGAKLVGNLEIASAAAAPAKAGMISAFGAIAGNAGFVGVYIDSTAETGSTYLITCDGVAYYATDLATDVLS